MSARLLAQPFGRWLVALAGAAVIGVGIYHIIKAVKGSFLKKWRSGKLNSGNLKRAKLASRIGLGLQGGVFGMIGFFLLRTAWKADPHETKGIDGTLQEIANGPYGQVMFTAAATGLFLYGVHLLLESWLRQTESRT